LPQIADFPRTITRFVADDKVVYIAGKII